MQRDTVHSEFIPNHARVKHLEEFAQLHIQIRVVAALNAVAAIDHTYTVQIRCSANLTVAAAINPFRNLCNNQEQ